MPLFEVAILETPKKKKNDLLCDFLNYGVVRGAIASKNRLARQCEAGEVPIASELGDAAYLWPKAYESASALDRGHV